MQNQPPPAGLLTPQEAAAFLGISVRMLNYHRKKQRIPCVRLGHKTIRYDAKAIRAALRAQEALAEAVRAKAEAEGA